MWDNKKPAPVKPDPTDQEVLIGRIEDAIWGALEADDNVYADRTMDMVDASGMGVDMTAVAAMVYHTVQQSNGQFSRTITNLDEINALPPGAVILDNDGEAAIRGEYGWYYAGSDCSCGIYADDLPARLLWTPTR